MNSEGYSSVSVLHDATLKARPPSASIVVSSTTFPLSRARFTSQKTHWQTLRIVGAALAAAPNDPAATKSIAVMNAQAVAMLDDTLNVRRNARSFEMLERCGQLCRSPGFTHNIGNVSGKAATHHARCRLGGPKPLGFDDTDSL